MLLFSLIINTNVCAHWLHMTLILSLLLSFPSKTFLVIFTTLLSHISILWHLFVSSFHTFVLVNPVASFPYILSLSFLIPTPPLPPSLPTVEKWRVARVPVWTGTPLGAVAHPGSNSLAPVVMWTSSRRLPQQQVLPRSPPSTSIRKMDKPSLNASLIGSVQTDWLSNTDR